MDIKTLHQLEKQLDTSPEKKSIKGTTAGQGIPEPSPAESQRAEMLPSGYALPKEQHLLLATARVTILNRLDLGLLLCCYLQQNSRCFMSLHCDTPCA